MSHSRRTPQQSPPRPIRRFKPNYTGALSTFVGCLWFVAIWLESQTGKITSLGNSKFGPAYQMHVTTTEWQFYAIILGEVIGGVVSVGYGISLMIIKER